MCRIKLIVAVVIALHAGAAVAQVTETPSPAQALLQQPAVEVPQDVTTRHPGLYAASGVLIAPPILFDATDGMFGATPPIPAPWATVGFRRASDVSWQTSFLLVPIGSFRDSLFRNGFTGTIGLDFDR